MQAIKKHMRKKKKSKKQGRFNVSFEISLPRVPKSFTWDPPYHGALAVGLHKCCVLLSAVLLALFPRQVTSEEPIATIPMVSPFCGARAALVL